MRSLTLLLLAVFFLLSCADKNAIPKGVLKPEKMQVVLWDVLRADAFTFDFIKKDTAIKPEAADIQLLQQVFAVHKVSKDEFYKSYDFYKAHPALMQPILDSLISKVTRDKYVETKSKQFVKDTLTKAAE